MGGDCVDGINDPKDIPPVHCHCSRASVAVMT
jgi:hypothetical protein